MEDFLEQACKDFPSCLTGVRRLIAVAPFMDVATSTRIGRWGDDAERILISSNTELDRIAKGKEDHFEKRASAVMRFALSACRLQERSVEHFPAEWNPLGRQKMLSSRNLAS
jgi:hypothetical protein